ncbi:hypothetical protein [Alteromonas stellipolaris]|uniref:hypothetical protein n=1 Tax=Alteromonas stellipolaris TaxID=233316 RepID=UPI003B00E1A1
MTIWLRLKMPCQHRYCWKCLFQARQVQKHYKLLFRSSVKSSLGAIRRFSSPKKINPPFSPTSVNFC